MPTVSWHKNIHLFVNDLDEYEMDLISGFYTKCEYVDILIRKIADQEFFPSTIHSAQMNVAPLSLGSQPGNSSSNPITAQVTPPSNPSAPVQAPLVSQQLVNQKASAHLHELALELRSGNLLTSTIGEHLRKIANTRKFFLF